MYLLFVRVCVYVYVCVLICVSVFLSHRSAHVLPKACRRTWKFANTKSVKISIHHHCHRGKLFSNILALLFRRRDRYRDKVTSRIDSELVWSDNWKIGTTTPARYSVEREFSHWGWSRQFWGFVPNPAWAKVSRPVGKKSFGFLHFAFSNINNPPTHLHPPTVWPTCHQVL